MKRQTTLSSDRCALLLRTLGDPDRLRIVELLRQKPYAVSKIASKLRLEVANVSHHLGVLRKVGLVLAKRDGKQIIYELPANVLQDDAEGCQHLNLGCCRLEIPVSGSSSKPA